MLKNIFGGDRFVKAEDDENSFYLNSKNIYVEISVNFLEEKP